MSGTIPEHDWTGQLRTERERDRAALEEQVRNQTRAAYRDLWFKVAGTLIATLVIGAFVEWGHWQALESSFEQRLETHARDIQRLEQRVEGIQGIRTDLAALGARFDSWRASDNAAQAQYRRQVDEQLHGIRDALPPAQPHRRPQTQSER